MNGTARYFLIDRATLAASTGGVVKARDLAQLTDAAQILDASRRAAARESQLMQQRREAACREGYERGMQEGLLQGREQLTADLAEAQARIALMLSRTEDRIVATMMAALSQVLGELGDAAVLLGLARQALRSAGSATSIRMRVAPGQAAQARELLADLRARDTSIEFVEVAADPLIDAGGCIVETECGAVDARLPTQLDAVRAGLLRAFAAQRPREA